MRSAFLGKGGQEKKEKDPKCKLGRKKKKTPSGIVKLRKDKDPSSRIRPKQSTFTVVKKRRTREELFKDFCPGKKINTLKRVFKGQSEKKQYSGERVKKKRGTNRKPRGYIAHLHKTKRK